MSDGSLSQDEIDALLSGVDSGGGFGGGAKPKAMPEGDRKAFQEMLEASKEAQSSNFSMMMGANVTFQGPQVEASTRDSLLQSLPEEVLAIKLDMVQGIKGEHLFVMGKEAAIKFAAMANHEEAMELDDMAISAVQEVFSTITGTLITILSEKTGTSGLQAMSAEGKFVPKAMVQFPMTDFVKVSWGISIDGAPPENVVEVFGMPFVKEAVAAAGGSSSPSADFDLGSLDAMAGLQAGSGGAPMGGMQMGGMAPTGGMQMGGMAPMGGMQMGGMQMGGMAPMGGMQMGGMASMGGFQMPPPAMQSVQFPNLVQQQVSQEQGNIGLIMDVYMEMTVELGRTKKLIKEILGMGEGTIIELDKLAGEPVDILVNHKLIAKGEVVVIDENFGVRVTEIVSPLERMGEMG
jgi:flagellar motor switch protein FliN/FliY